jgi:SAM-dependent methyltransferase
MASAERLPLRDGSLPAVISVMAHTDMPAYPAVLHEAARVLRPDGVLVHVGVHPCFCGGFADRADPQAIVIRPGYADGHWTEASHTDKGVRDRPPPPTIRSPPSSTPSPMLALPSIASPKAAPHSNHARPESVITI